MYARKRLIQYVFEMDNAKFTLPEFDILRTLTLRTGGQELTPVFQKTNEWSDLPMGGYTEGA